MTDTIRVLLFCGGLCGVLAAVGGICDWLTVRERNRLEQAVHVYGRAAARAREAQR